MPQCNRFVWRLTHPEAPQRVRPLLQAHMLETHVSVAALQASEQNPQLLGSLERSTQDPPQFVRPLGQLHVRELQMNPAGQTMPQPPQSLVLERVSTHPPSQFASPKVSHTQAPELQLWPAWHAVPQLPQLNRSWLTFAQRPEPTPPSPQYLSPWKHTHLPAGQS